MDGRLDQNGRAGRCDCQGPESENLERKPDRDGDETETKTKLSTGG